MKDKIYRIDLKKIGSDERHTYTGTFVRTGIKSGYKGPKKTVLLVDVKNLDGKVVTDHLWFNFTKGFEKADLHEGDVVQFEARVKPYDKGYYGYREDVDVPRYTDYKLANPSKVKVIYRNPDTSKIA